MNSLGRLQNKRKVFDVARRYFSQNTALSSINPDYNHKLRVMSTPEWPVPYWQRIYRADAKFDIDSGYDITKPIEGINDTHVIVAKEILKTIGKGYVVEAVENHLDITDYATKFEDSSEFTTAYVDDLLDCIDIATKQNISLLDQFDLADCLIDLE